MSRLSQVWKKGRAAWTAGLALAASQSGTDPRAASLNNFPPGLSERPSASLEARLEEYQLSGKLPAQREFAWSVIGQLQSTPGAGRPSVGPVFETWEGEGTVFRPDGAAPGVPGIRGFERPAAAAETQTSPPADPQVGTPVIAYTLYNDAARQHIRSNRLYSKAGLLGIQALEDSQRMASPRSIPPFPSQSRILKTVWWPVARQGLTALPVWDANSNPALPGGNPYTTWKRVVALDTAARSQNPTPVSVEFAGRRFARVPRVERADFHHVAVDADLAGRLMSDPESRRTALIALGRPLEAGDFLILVGGNLATRELDEWIWIAFWWHDHPDRGPFAAQRPASFPREWRSYLMSVAFDAVTPASADGRPRICFNPWLEGRFPDDGAGGGTSSNCIACHRRASFPPTDFLPVTRGAPDLMNDPAYARRRLRTSLLWSLALHAGR